MFKRKNCEELKLYVFQEKKVSLDTLYFIDLSTETLFKFHLSKLLVHLLLITANKQIDGTRIFVTSVRMY